MAFRDPVPEGHVRVQCITDRGPWADILQSNGKTELKRMVQDEIAVIPENAVADGLARNRLVVILG